MNDILNLEARLAAPPADVYRALTDQAAMRIWLAEHAEVAVPESRFEFWGRHTPQGDRGRHALVTAEPDRLLQFTWKLDERTTNVEIELQPVGEGETTLRLRQDGMPSFEELMNPPGRRDGLHTMHTFWGLALANLAEYLDNRPLTPKADFRPGRAGEIRVRMEIAATPEAVFTSLIDPAQIKRWFGWEAEVEPRVGGRHTLGVDGKIFEFEPNERLAYSDGEGSVVRWELEGAEGKTFLTFVQSGYADDELDSAAQHEAGWLGGLAELKRMHELGDAWTPLTTELPMDTEEGEH